MCSALEIAILPAEHNGCGGGLVLPLTPGTFLCSAQIPSLPPFLWTILLFLLMLMLCHIALLWLVLSWCATKHQYLGESESHLICLSFVCVFLAFYLQMCFAVFWYSGRVNHTLVLLPICSTVVCEPFNWMSLWARFGIFGPFVRVLLQHLIWPACLSPPHLTALYRPPLTTIQPCVT